MEACVAVEREVDKVIAKFSGISEHSERTLTDLANHLKNLKDEMDNCPEGHELTASQIMILEDTMNKVKDTVQHLASDHRDLHSTVSKVGKAIDRNFVSDISSTSREDVLSDPERTKLLNEVICQHFYRQGDLEIASSLAKEAGIETEAGSEEPFTELNRILDSLRQHDLGPALEWTQARRESLQAHHSTLEFKLHRLRFIGLLQGGIENQTEALLYARANFSQFVKRHETEIQNLMGMFLFLPQGLSSSPYQHLLEPVLWSEIYDVFTRDACALLGLSVESPLSVAINAGCTALPALLNIKQVMQQRQVVGIWNGKDELPIEIDVGPSNRYHSVFACPILRQQSSDANPPMRLVCGHVISRDALSKLINGNKLKCPYCPLEQNPNEARVVYF